MTRLYLTLEKKSLVIKGNPGKKLLYEISSLFLIKEHKFVAYLGAP